MLGWLFVNVVLIRIPPCDPHTEGTLAVTCTAQEPKGYPCQNM